MLGPVYMSFVEERSGMFREPHLFLLGDLGYSFLPIKAETSLSVFSVGAGGGISFNFGKKIITKVFMSGGYYYGFLNDGTGPGGNNPYVLGGADFHYFITPKISLGVSCIIEMQLPGRMTDGHRDS